MKNVFAWGLKMTLVLSLCVCSTFGQQQVSAYSIIPQPVKLVPAAGSFIWTTSTKIILAENSENLEPAFNELKNVTSEFREGKKLRNVVTLSFDSSLANEGYKLMVEKNAIAIHAGSVQGAFWAISSLKQLMGTKAFRFKAMVLRKSALTEIAIPCVQIEDAPRFAWRGIHLDVSRHFFDLRYLRQMIDRMAYYKFNKFHLHLTDDQGWRIEIKKYPELTAKGAWRDLNDQDAECIARSKTNPDYAIPEKHFKVIDGKKMYGGFYTQDEMKGLIAYATSKGVEIIPEIDMPGHMMAATNLMPWLTSRGKGGQAKDFSEPLCPCKETTFEFAENVFTEIAALFPSKYIHLGADEVEKSSWKNVPECEALMRKEGLKSVDELQSYFVRRMERFFNSKGKKLIGWDEILDGGVSATATMMYWRTWVPAAPKHAAEKGNDVIMTPGEFCYFDAQQDGGSLKKVYSFDPYQFNISEKEKKFIIGVQGNIWTEYIPSERRLEYMVFPRMLAMAEVAWFKGGVNWTGFEKRVQRHFSLLDAMHINYRLPDLDGFVKQSVFVDKGVLHINKPLPDLRVRYTTDGSLPTLRSKAFTKDLVVTKPTQFKVAVFRANNIRGEVYTINYEQQNYLAPLQLFTAQKGLNFSYYPVAYKTVNAIQEKDLVVQRISEAIEIPVEKTAGSFATRHVGYFYAAETGVYSFALRSDDGSVLKLGNRLLIDNDGLHPATEKTAQIALAKGYHPFELLFIEGGGGYTLQLQYKTPSGSFKDVDSSVLFH
uniref:family 20 glycosylhydrolase n=1 Tax=Pedobacter schmidteae TaxID=2201271 RepID=UPI000EB54F88|nr:family 20 glycosylhydrolase [Pedobacter schmidteae]